MRRIIERVVTVVTTTTWTIRWKEDPLPSSPEAVTEPSALIPAEAAQMNEETPSNTELKEADDAEDEDLTDSTADESPYRP